VELAGLESPFEESVLKGVAAHVDGYLGGIDDTGF